MTRTRPPPAPRRAATSLRGVTGDQLCVQKLIKAPAADLFAVVADPSRHAEFDGSGTVRTSRSRPRPLALGDTFGTSMHWHVPYGMRNTVVELEPDRLITWQTRPAYPLVGLIVGGRIWRWRFTPVDGGTEVTECWDIGQERFAFTVRPLAELTERNMRASLDRLERVVLG